MSFSYHEICRRLLGLDSSIRFVGIASVEAKILAADYRQDVVPLLTQQESELSIMQSLMRMSIRRTLESKLGKIIYATAVYQRVKRATITLYNDGGKIDSFLMVSFEKKTDHEAVIVNKILPFLKGIGKSLDSEN